MLYIKKSKAPKSLTAYSKTKNAYYNGQPKECTDEIREQLLLDQGYLCAYCMCRINKDNMKIEHWKPQSMLKDKGALNFKIMLGVCQGRAGRGKAAQTCDTHRGDDDLTVDPLNREHICRIQYKLSDGTIYSSDDVINENLNETLNLNCATARLKSRRIKAIKTLEESLSKQKAKGLWTREMLQKRLEACHRPDVDGYKTPFVGIQICYLEKRLSKL